MKLSLGDIIFGFSDFFKNQAFLIESAFESKIDEIEKRVKKLILFFASMIVFMFGVFFVGLGVFEYFKIKGAGAYLAGALFFFFVSLVIYFFQKSIK